MKTKKNIDPNFITLEKSLLVSTKPKSLRPMRSMVAVRSLKAMPATTVASIIPKLDETPAAR